MNTTQYFDALEPRSLLSAPVATVESFAFSAGMMSVGVRYSADTGIDFWSIDPGDLVVTGPGGLALRSNMAYRLPQGPTDAVVRYVVHNGNPANPYQQWPSGTYNLGIPEGAVRSGDGVGNAGTGAGSYWLWFPDTYVELFAALDQPEPIGSNVQLTGDGWSLTLTRWMRQPVQTPMSTSVRITGPGGDQVFESQGVYNAYANVITIRAENATGLWDYTDTGTYSIALGEYGGAQPVGYRPVAQRWLWFTKPKIEILSTDFTDTDVLITARFTDDHAIDPSSITWSAIGIDVGPYHIPPTIDLYHTVDPQQDGSVIGTFKRAWFGRPWGSRDIGDWRYVTNDGVQRVQDIDGNSSMVGVIMHQTHTFTSLTTHSREMAAYAQDPSTLTFKMTFWTANVDLATLGEDDVRLELNGHSYQLSLAYTHSAGHDAYGQAMVTAAYTLTLPQGERLDTGTAAFYMNSGALSISGQASSELFVGSWWLWFY
jgi:hypothetical protein